MITAGCQTAYKVKRRMKLLVVMEQLFQIDISGKAFGKEHGFKKRMILMKLSSL